MRRSRHRHFRPISSHIPIVVCSSSPRIRLPECSTQDKQIRCQNQKEFDGRPKTQEIKFYDLQGECVRHSLNVLIICQLCSVILFQEVRGSHKMLEKQTNTPLQCKHRADINGCKPALCGVSLPYNREREIVGRYGVSGGVSNGEFPCRLIS